MRELSRTVEQELTAIAARGGDPVLRAIELAVYAEEAAGVVVPAAVFDLGPHEAVAEIRRLILGSI
ncbi:hypothetical protein ACTU3I_13175 [Microbacterium sp. RD1]|uniref:hypothetical protein n=1 Tax=Microbacterium sp. RD1 TaxID=3457313 RepID=UPI003FA52794